MPRQALLQSIAATAADYRTNELTPPTPDHVDRWVSQFDDAVQLPILQEMDHVLKQTYFSSKSVNGFLESLVTNPDLAGDDPCTFWESVGFLDIQGGGNSQKEMLALFGRFLNETCGFDVSNCGKTPNAYVYLDDGIFSGNRVRRDLESWVKSDAPQEARLHVITIALHSGGWHYAKGNIEKCAAAVGKKLEVSAWRSIELEDRKSETYSSDVLRPTMIPNDDAVMRYADNMRFKQVLRTPGSTGGLGIFSSDTGRQLLEQEFLKAGVKIRGMCPNLGDTQRPLGHMTLETLGFGSLITTFRNCPNNAPLALWADDPWYPLFARKTNSATSMERFIATFGKGTG